MRIIIILIFSASLFASCLKKTNNINNKSTQLYPLAQGNVWVYEDSFFDEYGSYYGKDTFYLKTVKTINYNNQVYTPITDIYDDSIFTLRSDDSTVFIWEQPVESLMFRWPLDPGQPVIATSYLEDTLTSMIYTSRITTTNYPSYKIVITQDNGFWAGYRQQEMYFTIGLGIIKGKDNWKNNSGDIYTSDSYHLIAYTLQ